MTSRKAEFWRQLQAAKLLVRQAEEEGDLRRDMFYQRDPGNPDVTYSPTQTSNPSNPRTSGMEYWKEERVVRVEWGDGGAPYLYYEVTPDEWRRIARYKSAGRSVNAILNLHPYGRA